MTPSASWTPDSHHRRPGSPPPPEAARRVERPELLVADAAAWRRWLQDHPDSDGVRLVLAKKGTTQPTRLVYREALEEALCFGWIDGQTGQRDAATWRVLFTPRRPRSLWSKGNIALEASPGASDMFARLNRSTRYTVLYRVTTAKRDETRKRRIEQLVAMLSRGETPYAQKPRP